MLKFASSFIIVASLFVTLCGYSQNFTKPFEIKYSGSKVSNSLYLNIEYLDCRVDTTKMGFVQVGVMNRKARVVFETKFESQLQSLLDSITNVHKGGDTLLFQFRSFVFSEVSAAFSETGYCRLRANIYSKRSENYKLLSSIDTLVTINALDVTKPILLEGGKLIEGFVSANVLKTSDDTATYSYTELKNIDSLETRKIPVYTASEYVDGLYYTYKSFKNQTPDKQMTVVMNDDGTVDVVKVLNEENKLKKIKSGDVYAVVHKGKPYIATEFGYYPAFFRKNRLYFMGDVAVGADVGAVMMAGVMFGAIGGIIAASSSYSGRYVVIIDHRDGSFIYYREVPYSGN